MLESSVTRESIVVTLISNSTDEVRSQNGKGGVGDFFGRWSNILYLD